jgi:tRNA threonylcarbamoyl adenosine modification protein YeaZ
MIVLALDTTTRAGSLALVRDRRLLEVFVGDGSRTHAARLPGDLLDCLTRHGLSLQDVDLFAVAAGPGSFTGLRIGIATIQGLAFASGRNLVGVSALEALALSAMQAIEPRITRDVFKVLSVEASVKSRTSFGGTAPRNVARAAAAWIKKLGRSR